ncbi:hypothetical protein LTR70_003028 [Exophiala xenobiotica]|uniref:Uncharacterized protein n=1 Tax=Lithohypha guttulata TaxID=1690604 RepID=A0ABR0K929_9EURO|nr:hypothetical protein LTR24_005708 [Lithohypha guttulata]KAK5324398.1 hypothetical protein LTR70_003028 [Exophiala xenobiotica]
MPRQAHGRSLLDNGPAKSRKRKPAKGRGLNALETAEKQFPDQLKIRQHRLGEAEDDDDKPNTRADADERSAKRRRVDNTIEDADSVDHGSDPDGNPWHVGVEEDDDDSDIDSDEAFGESDEERFADFTFRGSENPKDNQTALKSKKHTPRHLNLDEDDLEGEEAASDQEEGDDDLGEDAIDLAAAWDLDDEEERKEQEQATKKQGGKKRRKSPSPDTDSSEALVDSASEELSDNEEDEYQGFSVSEDEVDEDTTARLRNFVEGLTPAEQEQIKTRRTQTARNLPDKPSQFALSSAGITAADLMQYVKDPTQKQSLKILQAGEREEPSHYKGGIPGKLAVPLAKRQQDRLDRVAAYDQSKQTMDRWIDTVKQNRRAEHISFPLVDPAKASASSVKTFQPISRTQPQSELESKIQEIMLESGLNVGNGKTEEEQEQQYEQLQKKNISLEEVQARRRELRMQRELMFREEVRAKRIKKIKSKAYRRVHRKEKDKAAVQERERLAAAGILNSDEEREQNDRRRAEERMGARHRESRWAKAAKATGQTTWNNDAKVGVSELARRDADLRRRVEGKNVRGSDESGSESESEYSESDAEDARWNEKLDGLQEAPKATGKSKLADMAFMKKAEAYRRAQNDEELRLLRRNMNAEDDVASQSGSDRDEAPVRQKFGNDRNKRLKPIAPSIHRNDFEERLSEDEANIEPTEMPEVTRSITKPATAVAPKANGNALPSKAQAKVQVPKSQAQSAVLARRPPPKVSNPSKTQQSALDDYTSPSESEGEQHAGLDDKDKLALDIFAGDDEEDLRKQFDKEKKEVVRDEGDQIVDNTLPGWGSWTGTGISKREQKKAKGRFLTTVKGIAPEARKDARLDRVIVNEKRIKKNSKYLATELPHPFESRQQYERSLRLPMGPEWSTRNHFQDAIKPRVLLKQGQVIKPMARPTA